MLRPNGTNHSEGVCATLQDEYAEDAEDVGDENNVSQLIGFVIPFAF